MRIHFQQQALSLAVSAALSLAVAACGGGSSSSASSGSTTAQAATLSGTAATGSPFAGALITVVDANGNTVGSATAGSYSISYTPANFTAPLVVTAVDPNGQIGTLVSVLAAQPAAGGSTVANVTTLTTAEVALLTSDGNPMDVVKGNSAYSAGNLSAVTTGNLQAAAAQLAQSLGSVLQGASVASSGFDPTSASFSANGSGMDAVLDAVELISGTVSGNGGSNSGLQLVSKANPTTGFPLNNSAGNGAPPVLTAPPAGAFSGSGSLPSLQASLQGCINSGSASSSACSGMLDASYLDNGYSGLAAEFPMLATALAQGSAAQVAPPQVLMFYNLGSGNSVQATVSGSGSNISYGSNLQFSGTPSYALVKIPFQLSDGTPSAILTVAKKESGGWLLYGNQNNYSVFVETQLNRRSYADATVPGSSAAEVNLYESGIASVFNPAGPNGSGVNAVLVQGPGLPGAGLWLEKSTVAGTSSFLTIASPQPGSAPTSAAATGSDTTMYRWSWVQQSGSAAPNIPNKPYYAAAPFATPAALNAAVPLFSAYLFTAYNSSGAVLGSCSVINPTPVVLANYGATVQWNSLASSVVSSFLAPGGSLAALQATVPVSWSINRLAFPVENVAALSSDTAVTPNIGVDNAVAVTGGPQTASATVTAPGSSQFQALTASGSNRQVQLRMHQPDGLRLFDQTIYRD